MASDIRWFSRPARLFFTLSMVASAFSLPLQTANDDSTGKSVAQPYHGETLAQDIPVPPSDGLSANAGTQPENAVSATNDNQNNMFPPDMPPPPPGAMNDGGDVSNTLAGGGGEPVPANFPSPSEDRAGSAVPDNNPPPAENGGQMFPPNIPPPPPGAVNDGAVQTGVPTSAESAAPINIPQPPPGNGGQMFPPNMPPPPPGAVNDGVQSAGLPTTGNQMGPDNFASPPANGGEMFPPNMPPAPPGAMNEPVIIPEITPSKDSQTPIQTGKAVDSAPNGSMFPPNMPPPPPGAFNEPPPGQVPLPPQPSSSESNGKASQFVPAVPPSDAAVVPVYVTGQELPVQAIPVPGGQNPFVDPANAGGQTPNGDQHDSAIENMYPGNGAVAVANPPPNEGAPPSNALSPSAVDGTGEQPVIASSQEKSSGKESQSTTPVVQKSVTEETGEEAAGPEESGAQPSAGMDRMGESSYDSGSWSEEESQSLEEGFEGEESFSEESFSSEDENEFDFSFLNMDNSESYESSEDFLSAYEESSDSWYTQESEDSSYSSFKWLLDSSESEWESEEDDDEESKWDSEKLEEAIEEEKEMEEALEHDIEEKLEKEFIPVIHQEEMQPMGTKLILYCIPAVILTVLILLAWRNYRGKIRVVTVPSGSDPKQYDWKPSSKSDEQLQPMLTSQDDEGRY